VDGVKEGARVVALTRFGGHSSAVVVRAGQVRPLPEHVDFQTAAAIPVIYLTAWLMLVHLGNVQAGDRVLVHAAAGGVGQAALQICRWKGAEVIGTASAGKHARLKEMGATHCIDYNSQDFEAEVKKLTAGAGVDLALDAVGGRSFKKSYRSLSSMGRLFLFGVSSMAPGEKRNLFAAAKGMASMPLFHPVPLMNQNRGVFGVNLGHLWHRADKLTRMLEEILTLVEAGTLAPVVDRAFPFEAAGEAHRYIQSRKNFGKVLLVP
jgi:synaptic vesicle membrane protein VAT-1